MPLTDAQAVSLLETMQNIERHLATLTGALQEIARITAQHAVSPTKSHPS